MGTFHRVANLGDLEPGQCRLVQAGEYDIALFNVGGEFYALDSACTHQWGPLADGQLEGNVITCPWHGASFDVRTGEVLAPPAESNVERYPVRLRGSDIEVEVPD